MPEGKGKEALQEIKVDTAGSRDGSLKILLGRNVTTFADPNAKYIQYLSRDQVSVNWDRSSNSLTLMNSKANVNLVAVNGQPLQSEHRLRPGDLICLLNRFGLYYYRVTSASNAAEVPDASVVEGAPSKRAKTSSDDSFEIVSVTAGLSAARRKLAGSSISSSSSSANIVDLVDDSDSVPAVASTASLSASLAPTTTSSSSSDLATAISTPDLKAASPSPSIVAAEAQTRTHDISRSLECSIRMDVIALAHTLASCQCGHSYCYECGLALKTCPFCRANCTGTAGLVPNRAMDDIIRITLTSDADELKRLDARVAAALESKKSRNQTMQTEAATRAVQLGSVSTSSSAAARPPLASTIISATAEYATNGQSWCCVCTRGIRKGSVKMLIAKSIAGRQVVDVLHASCLLRYNERMIGGAPVSRQMVMNGLHNLRAADMALVLNFA